MSVTPLCASMYPSCLFSLTKGSDNSESTVGKAFHTASIGAVYSLDWPVPFAALESASVEQPDMNESAVIATRRVTIFLNIEEGSRRVLAVFEGERLDSGV